MARETFRELNFPVLTQENSIHVLNWYREKFDSNRDIAKSWILDFCKTEMTEREVELISKINKLSFPYYLAVYAHQYNEGLNYSYKNIIKLFVISLIKNKKNFRKYKKETEDGIILEEVQESEDSKPKKKDKVSKYITEIETMIDDFINYGYSNKSDINFFNIFQAWGLRNIHYKKIMEYYKPLSVELYMSLLNKDEQLTEAYPLLRGKTKIKRYAEFVTEIINSSQKLINAGNKSTTNNKVVKKDYSQVNYMNNSSTYNIKSLHPSAIDGNNTLITFNEQSRILTVYYAEQNKTLEVNHTSIYNYDAEKSFAILLRKPEEFLSKVYNGNITYVENSINALTTKKQIARSVLNTNTLLLRIFRR